MRCVVVATTLRWLLVSIALLGAACVVAGIVFGVISSTLDKSTFFVLSFTFIGLGIVLVIVVCIGWRCAPAGHEPCHSLFRLGRTSPDFGFTPYEASMPRAPQLMHRGRNQWYGGFLYPEFRYGTPPPSYATSMEQYRQRVQRRTEDGSSYIVSNSTLTSIGNSSSLIPGGGTSTAATPPPSYHSRIIAPRIRPSIGGLVDLPPPYRSGSRRPSAAELENGVEVEDAGGGGETVVDGDSTNSSTTTTAVECSDVIIIDDQGQTGDPAVEITSDTPQTVAPVPNNISQSLSTYNSPMVRSIVRRFEDLGRKTDVRPTTAKTRVNSANCNRRQSEDTTEGFNCSSVIHRFENLNNDECNNHKENEITAEFQTNTSVLCRDDVPSVKKTEISATDADLSPEGASSSRDLCFVGVQDPCGDLENAEIRFVGDSPIRHRGLNYNFVDSSVDSSNGELGTQHFRRVLSRGQSLEDPEIGESGI